MKAQRKPMRECVQLMQGQLRSFLYEKTKRRPVVMVSLIEL